MPHRFRVILYNLLQKEFWLLQLKVQWSVISIITIQWKLSRCYWGYFISPKNPLEGEKNYGEK